MMEQIIISRPDDALRAGVVNLLQSQKLPAEDLPVLLTDFLVAKHDDQLVGVVGIERYGSLALLRSLAVQPAYRNHTIAAQLIKKLEADVLAGGMTAIYLLTETAANYFAAKGYQIISREDVPEPVRQSSEFSYVCPQSAVVMFKSLLIQ